MHIKFLVTMSNIAFESQNDSGTYGEWRKKTSDRSANALFWFTVIDLEVLLFIFVRSLREANFRLFISCLSSICTWMFALDREMAASVHKRPQFFTWQEQPRL